MKIKLHPWDNVATRITIIYLIAGIAWILISDYLLWLLVKDPALLVELQIVKGWGYVFVTSLLLYFLILGNFRRLKQRELLIEEKSKMLRAKNEELDIFIYKASHDLKGPVSSLEGIISLIRKESEDSFSPYINILDKISGKMKTIVLTLSQLGELCLREAPKQIDFDNIINEVLNTMTSHRNYHLVQTSYQVEPGLNFYCRYHMLEVVLNKIIHNSFDYCKPVKDAYIKIDVSQSGSNLLIKICDNGQGIKDDQKNRVFEMFYRGQDLVSNNGLGLYIAKYAVDLMEGKIWVESTYGEGSCFYISLPYGEGS